MGRGERSHEMVDESGSGTAWGAQVLTVHEGASALMWFSTSKKGASSSKKLTNTCPTRGPGTEITKNLN